MLQPNAADPQKKSAAQNDPAQPLLEITTSRHFVAWLWAQNVSLVFTTYQAGKLFLLGAQSDEKLSIFERTFNRAMGLHATPQTLFMSTLFQLWRFENALQAGQLHQGYDRLYVPQVGYTTGDVDIHDIVEEDSGRIVFVNTLFGCLATISDRHSFIPLWKPPFISKLAPEDRCHLSGLTTRDGRARYVTAVSQTDVSDGWRDWRRDGGIVIDVHSNDIILTGLSMPHSPRWYQDKLWLLDSGNGNFGWLDMDAGKFAPLTFCPGFLRGLSFTGDFAIAGLSLPRENKTFSGLALEDNLKARHAEPRCGLQVIDLKSGDVVHWLRIEGLVHELYDVVVLPGVRRPMALGLKTDEIHHIVNMGPFAEGEKGPP